MPTMLPTPSSPVKTLLLEQALIWGSLGGLALLLYLTGLDPLIARTIYQPAFSDRGDNWAWFLRTWASLPAITLSVLGLVALVWPGLWRTRPLLYKVGFVMALTTILGAGLFNQIIIKNLADRPRPRETILMQSPAPIIQDGFTGNSMPSGHAAMGFVLVAPFFPLRRKKPLLAKTFLVTGLTLGTIVGLSRMVLGAHYATDVLIAAALATSTAHLLHLLIQRYQRLPPLAAACFTLLCGATVILGNRFTGQLLQLEMTQPFNHINLPCPVETLPTPGQKVPTLAVKLNGYGMPRSNLKLINKNNEITLVDYHGIYHHLTCTATLAVPEVE